MALPTSQSVLESMLRQKVRFKAPSSDPDHSFALSSFKLLASLPCEGSCMDATDKCMAVGGIDGSLWVDGTLFHTDHEPILDVAIQPMTQKVFYTIYHHGQLDVKCVGENEPLFSVTHVDPVHPGGGVCFDDENHLYFAVGSGDTPHHAQDHRLLHGKILRIFAESPAIPVDNPFASGTLRSIFRPEIYHSGLRNPKELIWDKQLWVLDSCREKDGYQHLYCLEDPRNCRYGWYDGFRPMNDDMLVHESTYILPQATPHMSYQDPSISKSHFLDCLPEIGSEVVGGCLLPNHAFLFADKHAGFLAFLPKREMGNVISQDNEITLIRGKEQIGTITSMAGRGKEVVILSRDKIYRALPRDS